MHFVKYQLVFNFTSGVIQVHYDWQSFSLRVAVNPYVLNVLGSFNDIL